MNLKCWFFAYNKDKWNKQKQKDIKIGGIKLVPATTQAEIQSEKSYIVEQL